MKHAPVTGLLLAAILSTTACSHPRSVAAGVGGTIAVASIATGVAAISDTGGSCEDGGCDSDGILLLGGTVLLAFGAVMAAGSYLLASAEHDHEPAPIRETPVVAAPAPADARVAIILPARATDAETLRLARQANRAAAIRQCAAARLTLRAIASRDAAYHDELVATPAFAACR